MLIRFVPAISNICIGPWSISVGSDQNLDVCRDTARQRAEHIPPFKTGNYTSLAVTPGYSHQLLRDPFVVSLDQSQVTHVILAVTIKTCRDIDQLRLEGFQRRKPLAGDSLAEPVA